MTINNVTNNYYNGHGQKREGPGRDQTKKIQPVYNDKSKQQLFQHRNRRKRLFPLFAVFREGYNKLIFLMENEGSTVKGQHISYYNL